LRLPAGAGFKGDVTMMLNIGDLGRARPISRSFGFDRGGPVDRVLIDRFLTVCAGDIKGRTLEIGDDSYTEAFGGAHTHQRDVLHVHARNPKATIIGDLSQPMILPADTFDCAVITQTLHLIYKVSQSLQTLYHGLKPGGVLLATVPAVSQVSEDEWAKTWYWGFTATSLHKVATRVFSAPGDSVTVLPYGNPATTACFLHGLAAQEVPAAHLAQDDAARPTLLGLRAVRG